MKRKMAEMINVIFGFRKFTIMLIICAIGIIFRIYGLVSGAEMVDLFKVITVAFFGVNGIEHVVAVAKDYVNKPNSPQTVNKLADTDETNDNEEVEPIIESWG